METRDDYTSRGSTSDQPTRASQPQEGARALTFEEVYNEYGERVLNLLFRFTSREHVARDLLQDVFVKVYQNMEAFEQRSQIYTWIYRIAVNHALNYLKRERRTVWFDILDESVGDLLKHEKIEVPGLGVSRTLQPDEVLESSELDQFVHRAIESLPLNYRVPFLLFKDEHLSYAEIAKVLDISVSAVQSRIHRARKMLVKRLRPLLE